MKQPMIEILAPAGDWAMLRAAVFSGADCVYLGVEGFNARRGAANFGPEALRQATAFCHARGCKVYAAVNTLVLPGQTAALESALRAVDEAGCDAVILQDLATAVHAARLCPAAELHASTQMSVHSLAGVRMLEELGFSRVILSRELSGKEIAHIARYAKAQLEVFVHGALCVCVSGQCYASAFFGGRSANRGACAGPCRLPFRAGAAGITGGSPAKQEHHLSLKDLSVLDALPQLAAMGVASAKIEGRLRGPEYVAVVVDAARRAREGQPYDKAMLRDVFSRSGFTDGWYKGEAGAAMFGTRTAGDTAAAKAALPRARALYRRERPRVPVHFMLEAAPAGATLHVADEDGNSTAVAIPGPLAPAQNTGENALRTALQKTGGTPFAAEASTLHTNGLYLPTGLVNAARREALDTLLQKREGLRPSSRPRPALLDLWEKAGGVENRIGGTAPVTVARFAGVAPLPDEVDTLCDELILPLAGWQEVPTALRAKTWLALPRALFTPEEEAQTERAVAASRVMGFRGYEASNLAHLWLCRGLPLRGGFGLNLANGDTLRLLAALGVEAAVPSPELSLAQLRVLAANPGPRLDALVYGHLPLMLTRAQPLANVGLDGDGTLTDRLGKPFAVRPCAPGVWEILNPVPLWMADRLGELPTAGALLYFGSEAPVEAARVLRAFGAGKAAQGPFTRGLYDKGTDGGSTAAKAEAT